MWIKISDEWPPRDRSFALSWDGYWVKASRGNKQMIIAEWLGEKYVWDLNNLGDRYWFEVPQPPEG